MENVSKALLIAGAILVCILIVAVGMWIYNSSSGKITDSISSLSTQEIDVHNTKFTIYDGEQSGGQIKSLIGILISNSKVNKEESFRNPGVYIIVDGKSIDSGIPENGENTSYIDALENIRTNIETKHDYWVEITFQDNGLVDYLNISYDENNLIDPMRRK